MTSSALMAHGTQLKRAGTAIAEVVSISDPDSVLDEIDVTNTDSGGVVEKKAGLRSSSDITLECNMRVDDASGQLQLVADHVARTISAYTIEGPSTNPFTWSFNAFVKQVSTPIPVASSEIAKFTAVLCVTGGSSFGATASADLTGLAFSSGTLTPSLTAGVYDYADVTTTTTTTVTATKSGASLNLYVDGVFVQALTSGVASSAFATADGSTHTVRISTQDSGKAIKWYTVCVTNPL